MHRFCRFLAAFTLLAMACGAAFAYDNDTHYVLTYYLARKVGFTIEQARQIASANVSVDVEPGTEPLQVGQVINPNGDAQTPRILFHAFPDTRLYDDYYARYLAAGADKTDADLRAKEFARDKVAARQRLLWDRGLRSGNPGQYLHFFQDTYSHDIYWSSAGHVHGGHAPDFISLDLEKALRMAQASVGALQQFMQACMQRESAPVDFVEVQRVVRKLGEINPITLYQDKSPEVKDLGSAFEYLRSKVLKLTGTAPLADDVNLPDWRAAAEYIGSVLGEKVPEWISYTYPADGPSQDANWRVQGCGELPQDGELKAKVSDQKNGKPLSGARVTLALGAGSPEASGETVDGAYTFGGLKATDVTYRVQASLSGYQDGGESIKFGCEGCGNVVSVRLKALPGQGDAEFAANLAREEAWIRERLARLAQSRDAALAGFASALAAAGDVLARLDSRADTPGLPARLDAAAADLGGASDTCRQLAAAGQKMAAALARMDEEERQIEQLLNNARTTAQLCAQAASATDAERDYLRAQALQQLIDQQQAALGLLDVQMGDLVPRRDALLKNRTKASALLADARRSVGDTGGATIDSLETRLAELRDFGAAWVAKERDVFNDRLVRFRADNAELVDPPVMAAGLTRLRNVVDTVDTLVVGDADLARRGAQVEAIRARLAALYAASRRGDAAFSALEKSVAGAACLDTGAPDMRAGLASADATRFMAQLATDKMGPSVAQAIQACKAKQRAGTDASGGPQVQPSTAAANTVRCWPGSDPYWNETNQQTQCRCRSGLRWNAAQRACLADQPDPDLQKMLDEVAHNQGEANSAIRGKQNMDKGNVEKELQTEHGPSSLREIAQNLNPMGALLQGLNDAVTRGQGGPSAPTGPGPSGPPARPAANSRPPPSGAPVQPTKPSQPAKDDWFIIKVSALPSSDANYRKFAECRYTVARGMLYLSSVAGGRREVQATADALTAKGHVGVEVRYYGDLDGNSVTRIAEQWNTVERQDYNACFDAVRRASGARKG